MNNYYLLQTTSETTSHKNINHSEEILINYEMVAFIVMALSLMVTIIWQAIRFTNRTNDVKNALEKQDVALTNEQVQLAKELAEIKSDLKDIKDMVTCCNGNMNARMTHIETRMIREFTDFEPRQTRNII